MPDEPIVQDIIYTAPEPNPLDEEALDAIINEYIRDSLLPSWYQDLTKTALTRNITIDDWNTLCFLIRRVSADKVAYTTFKEFSDAIINYMKNNFSLKSHNLVSVIAEAGEIQFAFEDGGYFYLTERDLGLTPISELEIAALLDVDLTHTGNLPVLTNNGLPLYNASLEDYVLSIDHFGGLKWKPPYNGHASGE